MRYSLSVMTFGRIVRSSVVVGCAVALAACTSLGGTGPSTGRIMDAPEQSYADTGIQVIELESAVLERLNAHSAASSFAEVFGESDTSPTVVGAGDILDIAIWEAPPAVLFGSTTSDQRLAANPEVASSAEIPQQQVGEDGKVTVPFVGRIDVVGLRPEQIEAIVVSRLNGRANNPQALVRF